MRVTVVLLEIAVAIVVLAVIAALYQRFRRDRPDLAAGESLAADDPGAGEIVPLRSTYSPGEAEMIRGVLEMAGVPAMVSTDSADGWRAEGIWRPARVLVRAGDVEAATEILAAETVLADEPPAALH